MKRKIGTQLEEEVYHKLKLAAAKERRPIGELLQNAVSEYLSRKKRKFGHRSGLRRFLDSPAFKISGHQLRETMEADFYDQ